MPCLYCTEFAHSKRRLGTDENGTKVKDGKGRRICEATKAWKAPHDEICDNFQPVSSFWCDRLQQMMHVDACRMKKKDGKVRICKRCSQSSEIMDVIRIRVRLDKSNVSEPVAKKPVLLRRKK